jgi:lipoprotein-releasing system ATP-binding protein
MADMIRLENVNKIYGTKVPTQVLFDINLGFEEHSFNSIIGASGSGKSTLLNILGTLDRPTSGEVLLRGTKTTAMNRKQIARFRNETIGFIFQFHYLLPEYTALENVLMPARILGDVSAATRERAVSLMDLVGLSSVQNNLSVNMSGGQQQRTAIARALMNQSAIILADEPTGNLDSNTTESIYALLRKINIEMKTTFIVITHDSRIAEKADRIVEIKDGRIGLDLHN